MAAGSNSAYSLLHPKIQSWIYSRGWTQLNPAQVQSIHAILDTQNDLVISAPTASGKTEAAFLPLISELLASDSPKGGLIVYVSPLKALINDQWKRLESLCKEVDIQIIPWHGDISAATKGRVSSSLRSVILITPESLEAMLVNRPQLARSIAKKLTSFVLDEFHSFVGEHRGEQLVSLLDRFSLLAERYVRRVALSATLGDRSAVARLLSPTKPSRVQHIQTSQEGQSIRLRVFGFESGEVHIQMDPESDENILDKDDKEPVDFLHYVGRQIYEHRNSTNLIFPNSRSNTEVIVDIGNQLCTESGVPKCFWAHHGLLSKDVREDVEQRAREGAKPMSISCTSTLEMGIDIGAVDSVFQVGPTQSVSSLRQRLGRSGRRGKQPVLRAYVNEKSLESPAAQNDYSVMFRESLLRSMACLELIASDWYEPPEIEGISLCITAHQILSILAQAGGTSASKLWHQIQSAEAYSCSLDHFKEILNSLGNKELIIQLSNGMLTLSERGERMTHSMDFYTVFDTEREFSVFNSGNLIARIPISSLLAEGDFLLLAGRRWIIKSINEASQSISVVQAQVRGITPGGPGRLRIHTRIRKKMKQILESNSMPGYVDETSLKLLSEARERYHLLGLHDTSVLGSHDGLVTWFPWSGSRSVSGIQFLLTALTDDSPTVHSRELVVTAKCSSFLEVKEKLMALSLQEVEEQMLEFFSTTLESAVTPSSGKWSWLLPRSLKYIDCFSRDIDLPQAVEELLGFEPPPGEEDLSAVSTGV